MRAPSAPVLVLTAFFGLHVVGAIGSLALGTPFLVYQPPYWRMLLIYGGGAAYVGYLCWRRLPRARFAVYVFLTVDVIRAIRGQHGWVILIDLALLMAMQLPVFRAVYPAIRPTSFKPCRRLQPDLWRNGRPGPSNGSRPSADGRGHVIRS